MKAKFNGSKSKWESLQNSALKHLIYGLPERANYGMIVLGGGLPVSTKTCGDKNQEAIKLGMDTHGTVVSTIDKLNPADVASLGDAIKLSRNIFDQKQGNIQKKLFMFLGGGDDCNNEKWDALKYFLKDYKKGTSIDVSTEIVILADEFIDPDLVAELQDDITRLGLENEVNLETPKDDNELQMIVANIYNQTIEQALTYEPASVGVQLTVNVVNTTSPNSTTPPPITITQSSIAPVQITNTPGIIIVQSPEVTQTLIPTQTPPDTLTPFFTSSPLPTFTFTPEPSVVLTGFEYVGSGEGCSANIYFQVSGNSAFGYFRITNNFYRTQNPPFDSGYPFVELPIGSNG